MRKTLLLSLLLFTHVAQADYGFLPPKNNLILKFGGQRYFTSENFNNSGNRVDIFPLGTAQAASAVNLTENRLFVFAEYAIEDRLAAFLNLGLAQIGVDTQSAGTLVLNAIGLGDVLMGFKWRAYDKFPHITLETRFSLPTYSRSATTTELIAGKGDAELGFLAHTGFQFENNVFFSLSPGILFRFGGYASAFLFEAGVGTKFGPIYGLLFSNLFQSLGQELLFDTALDSHDALGAGGSYSRLAGSPSYTTLGLKLGGFFSQKYSVEAAFEQSLLGNRAPNFLQFTVAVRGSFDFYKEDDRRLLKEVPLREGL